jgi:hypothetical protein
VQAGEEEVTLSFFEIVPPLVIAETKEQMEILREQGISADCIARITIAKNRFPSFVEAIKENASETVARTKLTEFSEKVWNFSEPFIESITRQRLLQARRDVSSV